MKNQLGLFNVVDTELMAQITQDAEEGNALAEEHALDLAGQNLPKQKDPKRAFLGRLTAFFNKTVGKARAKHQSALSKWDMARAEQELNEKRERISKDVNEVNNALRLKKRDLEKWTSKGDLSPIEKEKRERRIKPYLFSAIVLDVAVSCTALMKMGYLFPIALGIGVVLGAIIYLLSDNFMAITGRFKRVLTRRLVGIGIFIGVFILFLIIGKLRSESITGSNIGSPLLFAFMNLFVFASIVAVTIVVKPTRAELKLIDQYKALKAEIKEAETKKQELDKELDHALAEFNTKKEEREKLMLYSKDCEALIVSYYESAVQTFISVNIQRRSDGVIPDMFSEDPPALTLHFTNQKSV